MIYRLYSGEVPGAAIKNRRVVTLFNTSTKKKKKKTPKVLAASNASEGCKADENIGHQTPETERRKHTKLVNKIETTYSVFARSSHKKKKKKSRDRNSLCTLKVE